MKDVRQEKCAHKSVMYPVKWVAEQAVYRRMFHGRVGRVLLNEVLMLHRVPHHYCSSSLGSPKKIPKYMWPICTSLLEGLLFMLFLLHPHPPDPTPSFCSSAFSLRSSHPLLLQAATSSVECVSYILHFFALVFDFSCHLCGPFSLFICSAHQQLEFSVHLWKYCMDAKHLL